MGSSSLEALSFRKHEKERLYLSSDFGAHYLSDCGVRTNFDLGVGDSCGGGILEGVENDSVRFGVAGGGFQSLRQLCGGGVKWGRLWPH